MKKCLGLLYVILLVVLLAACTKTSPDTALNTVLETTLDTVLVTPLESTSVTLPVETVSFSDPAFEAKVRKLLEKPDGIITVTDVEEVVYLDLSQSENAPESEKIHDISSLIYFKNLQELIIGNNLIEDISVLSELPHLVYIEAAQNKIKDLGPLSELTALKHAVFWQNQISDLSPIAGLKNLEVFSITDNKVTDITPLKDLTKLFCLELRGNYIVDFSPIAGILPNIKENDGFEVIMPGDIIQFTDAVLEERVRQAMNKPKGEITVAEAMQVTELSLNNDWNENIPEEIKIHDISSLKYFKNLFKLEAVFHSIDDINVVNYMPNLGILDINGSPGYDLSPVSNLHNLMLLNISGWRGSDLSPLKGLTKLEWLNISYTKVVNIEPLIGLTNLHTLYAEAAIEDFSPISKHKNLKTLHVLTGVEDKYIPDLTPLKDIYPNLTDKNFEIK